MDFDMDGDYINLKITINPSASEPPVTACADPIVLSIICDIISFNGQGQLCLLNCVEICQTIPE